MTTNGHTPQMTRAEIHRGDEAASPMIEALAIDDCSEMHRTTAAKKPAWRFNCGLTISFDWEPDNTTLAMVNEVHQRHHIENHQRVKKDDWGIGMAKARPGLREYGCQKGCVKGPQLIVPGRPQPPKIIKPGGL